MTNQDRQSAPLPKQEPVVYPRRRGSLAAAHRGGRWGDGRYLAAYRRLLNRHRRLIRRVGIGSGVLAGLLVVAVLGLWWRLSSGPIQLDFFTPWLASAIEENFGGHEHVEVGGTQFERTEDGGAAVRIRDIVVRDADGAIVAKAPKAEVRVSGMSLLGGHMRAESFTLVGAEMSVRIEKDGEVTIFAGTKNRPIATAPAPVTGQAAPPRSSGAAPASPAAPATTAPPVASDQHAAPSHQAGAALAALLAWIDGIGETGLDGHDLRELGLKNGTLIVDDRRTDKRWVFHDITLSLERPRGGGIVVTVGSENPDRRWALSAAITPAAGGNRIIQLEARQVAASDLLLALRLDDGNLQTNLPLSASLRGEIGVDGMPTSLMGRIVIGAGFISDGSDDGRLDFERSEVKVNWDAADRLLTVPFQLLSGGNRITLLAQAQAQPSGDWAFRIGGGTIVLAPADANGSPLILNRIAIGGRFDPVKRRLVMEEGDVGNTQVGLAATGSLDYVGGELRLSGGLAAKRMSVESLKQLWPVFVAPKVRDWFLEHFVSGSIERMDVAVNAPFNTLRATGPPIPDNGLSIEAVATGCVVRPVEGLPALGDADLTLHIAGRNVQIALGRATADMPSGRKLIMSAGLFEVPDTAPHQPPARVRFKLDGPVPAAAELLALDRLRDASGAPFDPATTHGTMTAQVLLGMPLRPDLPPGSTNYTITVDATNFSAEHMIIGQRVEAAALRISATPEGFQLKGDVKIGGTPATLEYHKARGDGGADISIQGMLDGAARTTLGLDPGGTISGSIPIRLTGRIAPGSDHDGRFLIEADLTPAQIEGFLPGWLKPAGKPSRVTFTLTTTPQSIRVDDLVIEGAGDGVRGAVELDAGGALQSAYFPSYGFADGDKATLKVERAPDGTLRVTMRGEVYDGRGFIKTMTGGSSAAQADKRQAPDVDLDIKLGAVLGFNGEALSNLVLKMSRRAGEVRTLGLSAKIGHDGTLIGELRGQAGGRQVVFLRTNDAGAMFRVTDVYARMTGGQMALTMDAPSAANPMQQGTLSVHDFSIHDEAELARAAANGAPNSPQATQRDMQFTSMRVDFTRAPGRIALRDGVARGPVLGGTLDGMIDYTRDRVDLRGTLVPLYGPNNLFGWIPVVGPILGGQKEGLVGFTYQVVGRPGNPVLNVNILSVLAPGLLRKIFEYPAASDNTRDDGSRDDSRPNSREDVR